MDVRPRRAASPGGPDGRSITYHDSCYLARHNDVLEGSRALVAAVGQPVEMKRSGKSTFCCGAGGAHMWMEERAKPISVERVRQAETGADALAAACPFCTVMLDDRFQNSETDLRLVDVATVPTEAIDEGTPVSAEGGLNSECSRPRRRPAVCMLHLRHVAIVRIVRSSC